MSEYYPPQSCYFQLSVTGLSSSQQDYAFKEISGIEMETLVEEISEGGQNSYKIKVPTGMKHNNLVAKRGFLTKNSALANWCSQTIGTDFSDPIVCYTLIVTLMNPDGSPLVAWSFVNAYPIKWSVSDLKSMEAEIAVESIEFAYNNFSTKTYGN